jgi:DNA-binding NtrC family response regulator
MLGHVLIIEDNVLLVKMYQSIFQSMQVSAENVASIGEAIRVLPTTKADLIILDDRLARSSSGETNLLLRSQLKASKIPLIGTMSRPIRAADEVPREISYASVIFKPFQVNAFSALVRRTLGPDHANAYAP